MGGPAGASRLPDAGTGRVDLTRGGVAVTRGGEQGDQADGGRDLGARRQGGFLPLPAPGRDLGRAAQDQPGQDRQADRAGAERQVHDDPAGNETGAEGQPVRGRGRAVVLPAPRRKPCGWTDSHR